MTDDVLAQKITSLQRCVARARETFTAAGDRFGTNCDSQDAAVLNIIRACDTSIDLANMLIRKRRLGIPSESRESFEILTREKLIEHALGTRLKKMVGFRNLAVHQYRDLDVAIITAVIRTDLDDLLTFASIARTWL